MSDDDKKDNVVPLFGQKEKSPDTVPTLLGELINDAFDNMSKEQQQELSKYMSDKLELRFSLGEDHDMFHLQPVKTETINIGDIDIDAEEVAQNMIKVETLKAKCFEYIKAIELAMFDAYMGFDRIELEKMHYDLQKIFTKIGKKG
tara:strand:+ start:168 stop:605 length:438 start_codon:yes stop_codon:yes gene_type:complete